MPCDFEKLINNNPEFNYIDFDIVEYCTYKVASGQKPQYILQF